MENIGNTIKKIRKNKKIPQKKICELANLSKSTYSRYENSGNIPIKHFKKICAILEINPVELFEVSSAEFEVLKSMFEVLSENGKKEALKRLSELARLPEYTKKETLKNIQSS